MARRCWHRGFVARTVAVWTALAAVVSGGCESEGDGGPGGDPGSDVVVSADVGADVSAPPVDPVACELVDYGYGEIWDGSIQVPAEGPEPEGVKGAVAAHNAVRRFVGVPDLAWSAELAADAQVWADHLATQGCALMHDLAAGQGENLAAGGGTGGFTFDLLHAIGGWTCEREDWDNEALSCNGVAGFGQAPRSCGHYTQVVWRSTEEVGCAVATCPGGLYDLNVYVCRYLPRGNWVGQAPY